jgi:hypothetical protein
MKRTAIGCALALLVLGTCVPRVAMYSPAAYDAAVSLKVDTRTLVLKSGEPFPHHRDAVRELAVRMEKAYEYARGIPDNELAAGQWEIMRDPARGLAGGLFREWEEQGTLAPAYAAEKSRQIDRAFDQIIGLESRKVRRTDGR